MNLEFDGTGHHNFVFIITPHPLFPTILSFPLSFFFSSPLSSPNIFLAFFIFLFGPVYFPSAFPFPCLSFHPGKHFFHFPLTGWGDYMATMPVLQRKISDVYVFQLILFIFIQP